jgi:LysR family transcriptional regulator, cell division regulator
MLPNAADLRNFIEAAATGNITRAAQRLGMAQPSLSQSIGKLERALGVTLLMRGKSGVSPTRAGRRVLERSRELLGLWEQIRTEALGEEEEIQGLFVIGCHAAVAQYTLPLMLPPLLADHARLRWKLVHALSRRVVDLVVAREVDLGFAVNPVRHPDLVILPIGSDAFALWHAPRRRRSTALICDPELAQVQWLLPRLQRRGLVPAQLISSDSLDVTARLGAAGAGYVLLPGRVAEQHDTLERVDPTLPEFADQICIVYRADALQSRAGKLVVTAARGLRAALRE